MIDFDMRNYIAPKSDQLNADDLIAGAITVTIASVAEKRGDEQPAWVYLEGIDRPWKPCLSMRRVLVAGWGPRARDYVGKSLTLYRDPAVTFGKTATGGIRISHMSHLAKPLVMALTVTRTSRQMYKVLPLEEAQRAPDRQQAPDPDAVDHARSALMAAESLDALRHVWATLPRDVQRVGAVIEAKDKAKAEIDARRDADPDMGI